MVYFCEKCDAMIIAPTVAGKKKVLECVSCGNSKPLENTEQESNEDKMFKLNLLSERAQKDVEEIVINEAHNVKNLPSVQTDCLKCGHGKAFFWTKQTRSSDEPETQFYQCEQCGHKWRDYGK